MTRRKLLTLAAALAAHKHHATAAPFPVHFRKPSPHEQLARYIQPGNDEFAAEAEAAQVHKVLTAAHPATRFYVLPNNRVRYETKAATEYRTGMLSDVVTTCSDDVVGEAAVPGTISNDEWSRLKPNSLARLARKSSSVWRSQS